LKLFEVFGLEFLIRNVPSVDFVSGLYLNVTEESLNLAAEVEPFGSQIALEGIVAQEFPVLDLGCRVIAVRNSQIKITGSIGDFHTE
jgi:hypothetical protein